MAQDKPTIQEMLTVEFSYLDFPPNCDSIHRLKRTITIGVYDTIEEAVQAGNEVLEKMSKHFYLRRSDKFKVDGIGGRPDRSVYNGYNPTKGVEFHARITRIDHTDLEDTITEIWKAYDRYKNY